MKTATAPHLRDLGESELYDHLRAVIEAALREHRAENEASCARNGWSIDDFRFDDGDGRMNLLGARGFSKDDMTPCPSTSTAWDDTCFVIYRRDGVKHVRSYYLNTEQNTIDPDEDPDGGKSYLLPGTHRYRLGHHTGKSGTRRALEPESVVKTLYDKNQNFVDDDSPGGPQWVASINIHDGGEGSSPSGWSLGCQTIRYRASFDELIACIESDTSIIGSIGNEFAPRPERDGDRVLIYTLVDGQRLVGEDAPRGDGERPDRWGPDPAATRPRDDRAGEGGQQGQHGQHGQHGRGPADRPTLRRGSTGEVVERLQRRLSELGHDPGTVDGAFGARTDAAVRSFQRAQGLAVDGIVGPDTWAALRAAVRAGR